MAEEVRALIRAVLAQQGVMQSEVAQQVGYTEKHISGVLSGRAGLSFDLAEQMLAVAGWRLVVAVAPLDEQVAAKRIRRASSARGLCPGPCGRGYTLTRVGLVRAHDHRWSRCPGSGRAPQRGGAR